MRSIITSLLLALGLCAAASAQINPATQIAWPTGAAGCVYAPATNACISAGAGGSGLAICPDTSGSATAQSCSTSPTFTPVANSCIAYSTTTTNSGTGLTINVNSLGAKSVAIASPSGWTTTLIANIIPANKPLIACYGGTDWYVAQTGTSAGSSGGANYVTANTLLSDAPGAALLVTIGSSEGMEITSAYPEQIATDLNISSGNQSIIQIGSASLPDILSCNTIPGCSAGGSYPYQNGTLPKPFPWGITASTKSILGFGFNDLSNMGTPTPAELDYFEGQELAYLYLLGVPDAQQIQPETDPSCVVTGTHTTLGNPSWPAGTVRMTQAGGTVVCVGEASYAGMIGYKAAGSPSTFSVTVVNSGATYNLADATGNTTITQNAGTYTSAWSGSYSLYAISQAGMPNGTTTVTQTCINPSTDACLFVRPIFLSATHNTVSYPAVVQQLAPLQTANGTCGSCIGGHSDAQLSSIRNLQVLAANTLRGYGLHVGIFDPNGAPTGANPNVAADMGQVQQFTVSAGGSGFTGSTATPTFSGGTCPTQPTGAPIPVSGGGLVTGTYYTLQAGACTVAPTITFSGGAGYTATPTLDVDEVHFNIAAGVRVAKLAEYPLNAAADTSDHYVSPNAGAVAASAPSAGPFRASQSITGNGNIILWTANLGSGTLAQQATVICQIDYSDPAGTGRVASAAFAFGGFPFGAGPGPIVNPLYHFEFTGGSKTFGAPFVQYSTSPDIIEFVLPIQNFVSGPETLFASCVTDGAPYPSFVMLPGGSPSGSTTTPNFTTAW